MDWFKNLKIQSKLFLIQGMLMSMVIILAIFAVSTIGSIEARYEKLLVGPHQRHTFVSDAFGELSNIRRYILFIGYSTDDTDAVEAYFINYQKSAKLFIEHIDNYYKNLSEDAFLDKGTKTIREEDILDVKSKFNDEYTHYVENIYESAINKDEHSVNKFIIEVIPLGDEIIGNLDNLRSTGQIDFDNIKTETKYFAVNSKYTVMSFSICILAIALMVSVFMSRVIKMQIVDMESAMKKIAKGDLTYPIRSGYRDELGALSDNIGDMVDTISELNKTVAVVDYLDTLIYVTDLERNLIYVNNKMADAYNIDRKNCINKKCYECLKHLDQPCSGCLLPKLLPQKESFPSSGHEYIWDEYLGIWLTGKSSLIRWVDGSTVQFNLYNDNTLKKNHEEQQKWHEWELREAANAAEEASRAKSDFLANMSHEIRTPMNSIIGFSELAMSDEIPVKTKEYLSKIMQSSEWLLQIINDILDISKIESGKIELEKIPFDLCEVFSLCQTAIMPKVAEKDIRLYCYAEPSAGNKLLGDPTRLRQALMNILSNAVKFTTTGAVKLLSSVIGTTDNSATIRFEVKDSGIGMTAEQIDMIFEPFMQADTSTTRKYGGTGLGLPITKNIIELMGGELKVESVHGIGSKFSFDLTFDTADVTTDISACEFAPNVMERPSFKGEILLCEDNRMNQQVITDHLSRVGLKTVIAGNGKEGVAIVMRRKEKEEAPFDLILMDIHMPVMDGLEAASRLTEIGNKTPIVAITANIMANDREIYRSYGMFDCVAKPFTSQALWCCLLKYLTPVKLEEINKIERDNADERLHRQLLSDFVKGNRNTFENISNSIVSGDIKLAYRLAHTLKGTAGLIGKTALSKAALGVEQILYENAEVPKASMITLKAELDAALKELAPLAETPKPQADESEDLDLEEALDLIKELEPLLKSGNPQCLGLTEGLRRIPGTSALIEQMEDFDFRPALGTLANIKKSLGVMQ